MKIIKLSLLALFMALSFTSCTSDDTPSISTTPEVLLGAYQNGVLIINQGNFGSANSTMSFLSNDFNTFQNNIYSIVNPSETLGDTAQDIAFNGDLAYVVMNVSNKIEIVNRYTLKHVASITTGLSNPRYITFVNGKGYVTNWGNGTVTTDDYVAVLNLANNTVSSTIPVVEGPEKLVNVNGKLYVAHAGGYGFGDKVSVVNTTNNTVETTITVGDVPHSLVAKNGYLYVMCSGKPSYSGSETGGKLSVITLANNTIANNFNLSSTSHPSHLAIDNDKLYYTINADVYSVGLSAATLPTTPLFSTSGQGVFGIYSFDVKNGNIYVGDAVDYSSNGKVYVYTATGSLLQNRTVGVTPAGFYFN